MRERAEGWFSYAALPQNLVPRNGHCLPAKLLLSETKVGDAVDAAWQNPSLEVGGGECCQSSNERMPCQEGGGMISENKVR